MIPSVAVRASILRLVALAALALLVLLLVIVAGQRTCTSPSVTVEHRPVVVEHPPVPVIETPLREPNPTLVREPVRPPEEVRCCACVMAEMRERDDELYRQRRVLERAKRKAARAKRATVSSVSDR